ncbi:hypothetical protein [Flintibacter muris]|uniref:hypothetical protein n=1 Tax=Flintibacter muris TaxID=2941327 RepID=UPI00203F9265|nr:hypothetical protein [Flintibacter muris]
MDQNDLLMELEEVLCRFTWGLNAIELMALGLARTGNPYSGGFQAVWLYLQETSAEAKSLLDQVSTLRTTA